MKCVSAERPLRVKAGARAVGRKSDSPADRVSPVAPCERTRAVTGRAAMRAPGCSKCRYAARGCRRCVANFMTASEAREKKAKAAEARLAKKASAFAAAKREKAENATSPGSKRRRDAPFGTKSGEKKANAASVAPKQEPARAHEAGSNHPKTPGDDRSSAFHEKSAANGERRGRTRVSFVSPPSTAKSGGDGTTAAAARAAIASASVEASDARDSRHDDRPTPAKKARRGPGPGPVARECATTTTTTTTTTTIALDVREDDMGALAHRLADYVGSYGSMDARDLLGVPCGGQMLCDALARAATNVFF